MAEILHHEERISHNQKNTVSWKQQIVPLYTTLRRKLNHERSRQNKDQAQTEKYFIMRTADSTRIRRIQKNIADITRIWQTLKNTTICVEPYGGHVRDVTPLGFYQAKKQHSYNIHMYSCLYWFHWHFLKNWERT